VYIGGAAAGLGGGGGGSRAPKPLSGQLLVKSAAAAAGGGPGPRGEGARRGGREDGPFGRPAGDFAHLCRDEIRSWARTTPSGCRPSERDLPVTPVCWSESLRWARPTPLIRGGREHPRRLSPIWRASASPRQDGGRPAGELSATPSLRSLAQRRRPPNNAVGRSAEPQPHRVPRTRVPAEAPDPARPAASGAPRAGDRAAAAGRELLVYGRDLRGWAAGLGAAALPVRAAAAAAVESGSGPAAGPGPDSPGTSPPVAPGGARNSLAVEAAPPGCSPGGRRGGGRG
jgi:hypothetical protein